jgi:predicted O-methyltransferase YrrM
LKYPRSFWSRLRRNIEGVLRVMLGKGGTRRYRHLLEATDRYRCRRIMEIGTWDGQHAEEMIRTAQRHWPPDQVEYYGFDLFEQIDDEKIAAEISKKPPPRAVVDQRLRATGARIQLIQGDTIDSLPEAVKKLPPMDLIFIDGGHSYETVSNDWHYCQQLMHSGTVVFLDDYWSRSDAGTDRVVAAIDRERYEVEVLDPEDTFKKDWGLLRVRFVRVRLRPTSNAEA